MVVEEYCPIINPKDGKCYKYEDGLCNKGPYCNFLHFKDISPTLIKSLKDEMYEIHPEYRKNRYTHNDKNNNYTNKKRIRRHEHTSSESSLDRYDKFTRKRIIHRWNDEYISNKKVEEKKKLMEKLERQHKHHKHKRKHKHHHHDSHDEFKSLNKKKYEEDKKINGNENDNYENERNKITEKSKSKSKSKKSEKKIINNENNIRSRSREININSDEEETISAAEFEKNNQK